MLISLVASAVISASAALTTVKAHAATAFALPHWWVSEAMCIHRHESTNWHRHHATGAATPRVDHGGMQIAVGTWLSLAPKGFPREPAAASPHEQLSSPTGSGASNGHRFGGSQWPYSSIACGVD